MSDLGTHADRAIYMLIAVLAISVALEDVGASAEAVLASVAGTAIALTLAEFFAHRVGVSISEHRAPTSDDYHHEYHAAFAGLLVAAPPTLLFLLAALGLMDLDLAFVVAQGTGFAVIGIYAYAAALASGGSRSRALVNGLGLTLLGGLLILLNSLLK